MKSFWLTRPGGFHLSEWLDLLAVVLIRYGQLLIFVLAMLALFVWYNSMQAQVADFLDQPIPSRGIPE